MKRNFDNRGMLPTTKQILLAGLCGGLAEIIWIASYSYLGPGNGEEIAREITASLLPGMANLSPAPLLGIAIHLVLSLALSLTFVGIVWVPTIKRFGQPGILIVALAVLSFVWAINFLVVLPILNPVFVTLLPDSVTLFSKMLFGVAMALSLLKMDQQEHRTIAVSGNL